MSPQDVDSELSRLENVSWEDAVQRHYDYYVWQERQKKLDPLDQPNLQLAKDRERRGEIGNPWRLKGKPPEYLINNLRS